jgi:FAD/FMN-containing dehydrogenase
MRPSTLHARIGHTTMGLLEDLRPTFRGELQNDAVTLDAYSHDASLFEIRPQLVAFPKDVADVSALVRFAESRRGSGVSLTARSAGTDMSGGALSESILVDFTKHFNRIVSVGAGEAVTQPGVFYRDFEKATLAKDLLLPSYPASRDICTVGGMAANNSGGEKSLRYGKTANYVKRLKVVFRDGVERVVEPLTKAQLDIKMSQHDVEGEICRLTWKLVTDHADRIAKAKPHVSKNSAGYALWDVWDGTTFDLTKVLVGSQGTLGIITEVTYRLVKPQRHSKLLVIFLKDLGPLPGLVNAVLAHGPESFESYDDHTLKFAFRYFGDIAARLGTGNMFSLAWRFLPEAWMIATRGFPKLVMLAEFTGDSEEEVDAKIAAAAKDVAPFKLPMRITKTEAEAEKYWVIRRESFNLLRKHFKKMQTAPFIDDFCVLPAQLPEFLPKLYAVLDKYKLLLTVVGHVGDANFHIIPIMNLQDEKTKTVIAKLSKEVYDLVFSYGGSMTGEHNDGLIRGPFLRQMFGDDVFALFEETKRIFDPDDIFNPGKKAGANLSYAMAHLKGGAK